jgi:hypothetical protein
MQDLILYRLGKAVRNMLQLNNLVNPPNRGNKQTPHNNPPNPHNLLRTLNKYSKVWLN